jgi:hypothetical protein
MIAGIDRAARDALRQAGSVPCLGQREVKSVSAALAPRLPTRRSGREG